MINSLHISSSNEADGKCGCHRASATASTEELLIAESAQVDSIRIHSCRSVSDFINDLDFASSASMNMLSGGDDNTRLGQTGRNKDATILFL